MSTYENCLSLAMDTFRPLEGQPMAEAMTALTMVASFILGHSADPQAALAIYMRGVEDLMKAAPVKDMPRMQ